MRASLRHAVALISLSFFFLPSLVQSQACVQTSQNPRCDPSFANLICCPYPNVCYWADRQKTPACCAQGQVCGVGGGGAITVTPASETTVEDTQPTATTTLGGGGVVETVTSGAVGVFSTVTSGAVGVYSTVTSAVGGAFATVSGVLVGRAAPKADVDLSFLILPLIVTSWALVGATGFFSR